MRFQYAALGVIVSAMISWAQTQPVSPQQGAGVGALPRIVSSSRLVVVEVVPTDSHGNFVPNLTPADFELFEDGKPQSVFSFDVYAASSNQGSAAAANSGSTATTAAPGVPPNTHATNIVLLDSLNTTLTNQADAKRALLRLLHRIPKGESVAIFGLTYRLHLLQEPSADTEKLARAADRFLTARSPVLVTTEERTQQEEDLLMMQQLGVTTQAVTALRQFMAESNASATDMRVVYTCDALRQLSRTVARYPGRKNLLWLSGSFPLTTRPDFKLPDPFIVHRDYAPLVRETAAEMSAAKIAVYPIDVRGLITDAIPADISGRLVTRREGPALLEQARNDADDPQDTMKQLAEDTGGKAFYNTNDLQHAIGRSISTGSAYYTLTYVPSNRTNAMEFHKIRVQLKNAKHVDLAYKRGYYPLQTASYLSEAQLNREFQLAMDKDSPRSNELLVIATARENPDGSVTIQYTADGDRLSYLDDHGQSRDFMIAAGIAGWDGHGKPSGGLLQKVNIPASPEAKQQISSKGLTLQLNAKLRAGTSRIRLGIMDVTTGRIGTTDVDVVRP